MMTTATDSIGAEHERNDASIRVWIAPYAEANPYQVELRRHLAKSGLCVETRSPKRLLDGVYDAISSDPNRGNVIHLHWLPTFRANRMGIAFYTFSRQLAALRRLGCPVIWTAHNLYQAEAKWKGIDRWLTRSVCKMAKAVIIHAPSAAAIIRKEFRLSADVPFEVIYHPSYIDCYPNNISRSDARRRLGIRPDSRVLLFFGAIRKYKGVPDLVVAFSEAAAQKGELVIAGKPYDRDLVEGIRRHARGARVHLYDRFIRDDEVEVFLNACDLVVFPYRQYLTSGAVLLAMSFARACIAPNFGFMADVIGCDGGFLYSPSDRDGLALAVRRGLAETDEALLRMGRANYARASQWTWESAALQTVEVYRRAVGFRSR